MPTTGSHKDCQESGPHVRNLNAHSQGWESESESTAKDCQESECPQPRMVRNLNVHSQGLSGI